MTINVQWVDPASKLELDVAAGVILGIGDTCYWDGSALQKADASAIGSAAEFIAVNRADGDSNENGKAIVAKRCTLYDDAAGFTAGIYYLSETAAAYTATRPTTANTLRQQVGYAHTTSYLSLEIKERHEVVVEGAEILLADTAARLLNDTGTAAGVTLAAANDDVTFEFNIPENAVAIIKGEALYGCDVTLDSSDTVSGQADSTGAGLANDVSNGTAISATGLSCTADEVAAFSLTAGLDVTVYPGGKVFVNLVKAAEGSGGDDPIFFRPSIVFECV